MKLKVFTVAQVNNYIKRILQSDPIISNISVSGELSNIKYHGSGNVFLTLKDENSKISCFISYQNVQSLRYILEDGMKVTAVGYIFLYDKNGTYSLNIKDIEIEGAGNLHLAFEKLKAKLTEEGLFNQEIKKEIPFFPKRIAVVTSETGAAVRDIITTIKKKNDYVDVVIFPSLVQGDYAGIEIAKNIDLINEKYSSVDTIIIGRGGGSLEELWAFNEEVVARSIYNSKIPIISAVGHETDFSIADFVADYRAATPTAAAEKAVPNTKDLKKHIEDLKNKNKDCIDKTINDKEMRFKKHDFSVLSRLIENNTTMKEYAIDTMLNDIMSFKNNMITKLDNSLEKNHNGLENLSPMRIMESGYSIIQDSNGKVVKTIDEIQKDDIINIMLTDGDLNAKVLDKNKRSK